MDSMGRRTNQPTVGRVDTSRPRGYRVQNDNTLSCWVSAAVQRYVHVKQKAERLGYKHCSYIRLLVLQNTELATD